MNVNIATVVILLLILIPSIPNIEAASAEPDFGLFISQSSFDLKRGEASVFQVGITSINNFTSTVMIFDSMSPIGIQVEIDKQQLTPPDVVTITLRVPNDAFPTTYYVNLTFVSGSTQKVVQITVNVFLSSSDLLRSIVTSKDFYIPGFISWQFPLNAKINFTIIQGRSASSLDINNERGMVTWQPSSQITEATFLVYGTLNITDAGTMTIGYYANQTIETDQFYVGSGGQIELFYTIRVKNFFNPQVAVLEDKLAEILRYVKYINVTTSQISVREQQHYDSIFSKMTIVKDTVTGMQTSVVASMGIINSNLMDLNSTLVGYDLIRQQEATLFTTLTIISAILMIGIIILLILRRGPLPFKRGEHELEDRPSQVPGKIRESNGLLSGLEGQQKEVLPPEPVKTGPDPKVTLIPPAGPVSNPRTNVDRWHKVLER